ncbi:MAG: fasciclin domain-containing protein [Actinomycetota bacterium]
MTNGRAIERVDLRRYRRRIIGWGAGLALVVLLVGAIATLVRVENDLEARTEDVLAELGYVGLAATFDGQDGTIACAAPVASTDVDVIETEVASLRGVRSISVEPACIVAADSVDAPAATTDIASDADDIASRAAPTDGVEPDTRTSTDDAAESAVDTTASAADDGGTATIGELIAADPQFSALRNAASIAGLDEFDAPGAFTIFAPTNDAFGVLDPAVAGELNADPQLMEAVLAHHVIDEALRADELPNGDLTMGDGTTVTIASEADGTVTVSSGDVVASVTSADLTGSNGVLHVIDQVLLPADLDLGLDPPAAAEPTNPAAGVVEITTATYRDGQLVLDGTVADESQRAGLVGVATARLDADNVVEQLTVDAQSGVDPGVSFGLAVLIDALVVDFADGTAAIVDDGLVLRGTVVDDAARARVETATAGLEGVQLDIADRPGASVESADALAADMSATLATTPIEFAPGSDQPLATADVAFDRLAADAKRLGGVLITIEGHTDTAGDEATNLALSQLRADAVVAALVERGVPPADLVAIGRGETSPIIVDGEEDAAASRRVTVVVELR